MVAFAVAVTGTKSVLLAAGLQDADCTWKAPRAKMEVIGARAEWLACSSGSIRQALTDRLPDMLTKGMKER